MLAIVVAGMEVVAVDIDMDGVQSVVNETADKEDK